MVSECFAVTPLAGYRLSSELHDGVPVVEKIATRTGKEMGFPVGWRLSGGSRLWVSDKGLYLFNYRESEPADDGYTVYPKPKVIRHEVGDQTAELVALFLNQEEVEACLKSDNLKRLDQRWEHMTKEAIIAIGPNHTVFELAPIFKAWCNGA